MIENRANSDEVGHPPTVKATVIVSTRIVRRFLRVSLLRIRQRNNNYNNIFFRLELVRFFRSYFHFISDAACRYVIRFYRGNIPIREYRLVHAKLDDKLVCIIKGFFILFLREREEQYHPA